ncbi:MAG: Hsp20/alpha crystallin family protein [Natrialbaceae archaeon]|nr:Hsp20/alpha crystallin family protein [Natrialbaceae archaeon]
MRRDRDNPFDDLFREIERMMNDVMSGMDVTIDSAGQATAGFGTDTHVDIHESPDEILVVADLPGVEKDAIDLQCDGTTLTISAQSDHRDYDDRVTLPRRVDEHSANASFNNGVLEVSFDPASESSGITLN